MKKLVLPLILITGVLYLVSGKVHHPLQTVKCTGAQKEKDILLPVELLKWALEAP
jgi:uncharacterized iron-regulated membrane protein